jgi:HAD superfamily hydrolase (TIGR01549 family)
MHETKPEHAFDAVIFDLDGTLADTLPTVVRVFNQLVAARIGREMSLADLLPYFGPPETEIIRCFFPGEEEHRVAAEEFHRLSRADGEMIKPFAGIRELLTELRGDGLKLAVYSGAGTEAARIRLTHAGLLGFFDEVLGGDQVTHYKPHPEGVIKLIERFGVEPQATIFVGDTTADIAAGRGAGTVVAAVTWGAGEREALAAAGPDFLVDNPEALSAAIKVGQRPSRNLSLGFAPPERRE